MDKFIFAEKEKIHVYSYGAGSVTIVFLSGSGVLFPQLEYKTFQEALAETYRVVGIEKPGYGYSDISAKDRTVDVTVSEYRCVLRELGITEPVVLAAHSMGFLEALYWGQRYPSEILGILGVDPATPQCYQDFDLENAVTGLRELSGNVELRKNTADAYISQLLQENLILPEEAERYGLLAAQNLANQNWISEAVNIVDTLTQIEAEDPFLQLPMLFFISNGEGTTVEKDSWISHATQYLGKLKCSQYESFDFPHNLYKYAYKAMARQADEFIGKYIR